MIFRQIIKLIERVPWLKKRLWRSWYQTLGGDQTADWRFMNYGYASLDESDQPLVLHPDDELQRSAIALYHRVVRSVDLEGREVLEVGSGRGGGSSFVKRYHHPKQLTGVDFSEKAVQFCRETYQIDGLSFVHGDAEALPFDDESFDAVINVESSHCYGSMPAFLREAGRVLRPRGYFLFADLRFAEHRRRLQEDIANAGMAVIEQQEITANVLEALRQDSAQKQVEIERSVSKGIHAFREFAAVEGSDIFDCFQNGKLTYVRYLLQK